MKNLFFLMLSIAFISLTIYSCNNEEQDFTVEEQVEALQPAPYDADLFIGVAPITDFEIKRPERTEANLNLRDGNCENWVNVLDILWSETLCLPEYPEGYCLYLYNYYFALALYYEYDCNEKLFCTNCGGERGNIAFVQGLQQEILDSGLHPSYAESFQPLIDQMTEWCNNCPR